MVKFGWKTEDIIGSLRKKINAVQDLIESEWWLVEIIANIPDILVIYPTHFYCKNWSLANHLLIGFQSSCGQISDS